MKGGLCKLILHAKIAAKALLWFSGLVSTPANGCWYVTSDSDFNTVVTWISEVKLTDTVDYFDVGCAVAMHAIGCSNGGLANVLVLLWGRGGGWRYPDGCSTGAWPLQLIITNGYTYDMSTYTRASHLHIITSVCMLTRGIGKTEVIQPGVWNGKDGQGRSWI